MNKGTTDFPARLAAVATETEVLLQQLLADAPISGEAARPPRLVAGMRHAALDGGKRLRPFLLVETAAVFGAARSGALMAGAGTVLGLRFTLRPYDLAPKETLDLRPGGPALAKA